jgi:rare lipoprotein A
MMLCFVHRRLATLGLLGALAAVLAGCGGLPGTSAERDGPGEHRDVSHVPDAVPRVEPRSRGGNPVSYVVFGRQYHTLQSSRGFTERGIASWYGRKFHGRRTSNGEVYDMYSMSAAHKKLPIPTYVEVTNLENGRKVVVRVNDRGPFHDNRIIDLSYAAASRIGMLGNGTALVEIRAIDPAAPKTPPQLAQAPGATAQSARVVQIAAATAATAAPPAAPAGAAPAPRIYLQAGAFSDSGNAERMRMRLEQGLARHVRVIPVAADSGPVHRVQVGPLASVEVADQVSTQMSQLGISEPLVVID